MKEAEKDYKRWENKNFIVESSVISSLWDEVLISDFYKKINKVLNEIYEQLGGNIDGFICSIGTGGTLTGIARYLKSQNKNIYSCTKYVHCAYYSLYLSPPLCLIW